MDADVTGNAPVAGTAAGNGERPSEISDYALLSDRRTAALVSRSGSVDWWCVPRFDGGAVFASLLGTSRNGRFLVAPRPGAHVVRVSRGYRAETMVLDTEFECAGGRVRVIDFLAEGQPRPTLVRIVEGIHGSVPMRCELVIRFDYGSIVPWVRRAPGGIRALGGPDAIDVYTPVELRGEGLTSVATFEVRRGDRIPFVASWSPSHEARGPAPDVRSLLDKTLRHWRAWSARCGYQGPWRAPVQRSLLTLESLTYAPTGGMVAAATTSLPENERGTRNWDYRYCWLRDATLTLEAFLIGGYQEEARRWRQWLMRAAAGSPDALQTLYGVAGERRIPELELDWLPGYRDSRPVRVGNAAHLQLQLDTYGELADVLWQSARAGVEPGDAWDLEVLLLDALERRWREPDEGIWETRGGRQHFTHSKVLAWAAFDRAVSMVEHTQVDGPIEHWRSVRDEIHREVCARAFDGERRTFVQAYGSDRLDAAVLMIPIVGFLPPTDERVLSTIDTLQRHLTTDGLVRRYDAMDIDADGIGEPEGVFLPCSFWMVEALALAGRRQEARELFTRLLGIANDVGLYPEEFDPVNRRALGNFPQAFTHLSLVGAAHALDRSASAHTRHRSDRVPAGGER